jgi:copper chaperone
VDRAPPRRAARGRYCYPVATNTYAVTGMTCGHCVSAVSEEVGQVPGVTDVAVNLESGTVTITSDQPVEAARIREAVEEAGYALTGSA